MKTTFPHRFRTLAALSCALLQFDAISIQAGDQVPFRATWDAAITFAPLTPPFDAVSGLGVGRATHLGKMTTQSIEEVVNLATGEGAASYRFTAADGDQLFVRFVFVAIPIAPGVFSIQGEWQFTGGTGRFISASGAGEYGGQVNFTGEATAVGHFEAEGTLSSPGSLK